MTSVTCMIPVVTVPVLSRAAICVFPAISWAAAVLKRIPFFAPTPFPTMMATGVASPSAHGQLITRTATARESEVPMSEPSSDHTMKVTAATAITAGTNIPEILSAIFAIGAFVAAASPTICIICERVVSSPTFVASHFKNPVLFTVPALTLSPSALSTGTLSPVSADSSTALSPSTILPSTGTFSPGRTTKMSPFCTCSTETVFSFPSSFPTTTAVFGASFISFLRASVVRPLERASSVFPTVMSVRIIAAVSK